MLENIVDNNIKHRDIILGYSTLNREQLFNQCVDSILNIIDEFLKINNDDLFNKFRDYIQLYYPK